MDAESGGVRTTGWKFTFIPTLPSAYASSQFTTRFTVPLNMASSMGPLPGDSMATTPSSWALVSSTVSSTFARATLCSTMLAWAYSMPVNFPVPASRYARSGTPT